MTNTTKPVDSPATGNATGMRSEILQKWPKFTAQDVAALRSKDELVAKVQYKYRLDKMQAQKDVDAFAKGRQL